MIRRPSLGIALGSGSARGRAHTGVLLAGAEHGNAPDFIAGCSMGNRRHGEPHRAGAAIARATRSGG